MTRARASQERSTKTRRTLAAVLVGGLVLAGSLMAAAPASAGVTPASCTQAGALVQCAVTYTFTGGEQEFVVPAGITSIDAQAVGARGGARYDRSAIGYGAAVSATLAVAPGQSLFVEIGGIGSNSDAVPHGAAPGGFNGGGNAPAYFGPNFDLGGGGGGGGTDVRTVSSTVPASLLSRVIVAGGGGGGAFDGDGGSASSDGSVSSYSSAGHAGTASAGGGGGTSGGASSSGQDGALGLGGDGSADGGGAGGGGGLYGGGGASTYGGGGGGSSLGVSSGPTTDAASVTLSYAVSISSLTLTAPATTAVAGDTITFGTTGHDEAGDSWDATAASTFVSTDGSDLVTGGTVAFGTAGIRTITASDGGQTDSVQITVAVGPMTKLEVTSSAATVASGGTATFTAKGQDVSGDDLGTVTPVTAFSSSALDDNVLGNTITFGAPGTRTITGTLNGATGSTDVVVTARPMTMLVITPAAASVTAGDTVVFTATGFDSIGTDLGDQTSATVFTSTAGADTITTNSIRFTTAGTDTVTATAGGATATVLVTVTANAADPATITIHTPETSVPLGGSITLAVSGVDRFGNPIADLAGQATFTSDWAVDVVDGSTITFPHASVHVITATIGGVHSAIAITVTDPAASGLAATGVDPGLPIAGGAGALLLGLLALAMVRRRRGHPAK